MPLVTTAPITPHKILRGVGDGIGKMLISSHSAKDLARPVVADLGVQVVRADVVHIVLGAGLEAGTNTVEQTGARVRP